MIYGFSNVPVQVYFSLMLNALSHKGEENTSRRQSLKLASFLSSSQVTCHLWEPLNQGVKNRFSLLLST